VAILRLTDVQLTELHRLITAAVLAGQDPASVPLPRGVADYQRWLMVRVILAPATGERALAKRRPMAPTQAQAEQRLEQMVVAAEQAQQQAERWLAEHGAGVKSRSRA
jgi:hypothetical protein